MKTIYPIFSGKVYHIIPEYRMPGIDSFSRWKERAPRNDNLAEFGRSIAEDFGERISSGIISYMREAGPDRLPSVTVSMEHGTLHLPPKMAYLFFYAAITAGSEKLGFLLASLSEEACKPENTSIMGKRIILDVCMGGPRLCGICVCHSGERLARWLRVVRGYDPQGNMRVLQLEGAEYGIMDVDVFTSASDKLKEHMRGLPHGSMNRLIYDLFAKTGTGTDFELLFKSLSYYGRDYYSNYSEFRRYRMDCEAVVTLFQEVRGSFITESEIAGITGSNKSAV